MHARWSHGPAPVLLAALLLSGCSGKEKSPEPPAGLTISDAAHGGRAGFYFLPGLAPTTALPTPLRAELTVAALLTSVGGDVLDWTSLALDGHARNYHGVLDLPATGRAAGTRYRVRVLSDTEDLGHVDVEVVGTGAAVTSAAGEVVPLAAGKLPVKVHIQGDPTDTLSPVIDVTFPTACAESNWTRIASTSDGFSFTVSDANLLDVRCALSDVTAGIGPTTVACVSPFSSPSLVDDHLYSLQITAFDGIHEVPATVTWRADAHGPVVDFVSPAQGGTLTLSGAGPFEGVLTITDVPTAGMLNEIYLAGSKQGFVTTPVAAGTWDVRYTIPSNLTSGVNEVVVTSADCVGHVSTRRALFTVVRN
jgi:hypothetical protein